MRISEEKILEALVKGNYLGGEDLKRAQDFSGANRVTALNYLESEGIINKNIIGQALAESYDVDYADLDSNSPDSKQIAKIPENLAKKLRVVLYREDKEEVIVTTDNPAQESLESELQKIFPNKKVIFVFSLPEHLDAVLSSYQKNLEKKFLKIISDGRQIAPLILETTFEDAITLHVSDIHFEPGAQEVLVRFRIDGVLHDVAKMPKEQYENVLNRIKVQSGIRLDEHYSAQDGAMQYKRRQDNTVIDLRVSIVPVVEGEKVVLRILSSYIEGLVLSELGFLPNHRLILEEAIKKPFGMIMVAGPTGSGKTTTLYALLKILNQSDVNITTIEDPVEYKMRGVNQIQVNSATNLTFAQGLRSIVRQDPDIILVGEIRDEETAEIAVNAALTGHLLLSTFHSNDAATVIPRLLDMKIEPFLLASTFELIVAQRLVRKICVHCKESESISGKSIFEKNKNLQGFFEDKEYTLYKGKGCIACDHTGYLDRTALFEIIQMTPELKELILKNPSSQSVWDLARNQGTKSIFEDGVEKVKNGVTTLEELLRVALPPNK